jgi:hypothetical protein
LPAPPRSRRKRILRWTTAVVAGLCVLYFLASYATSPFFESKLLGGQHPDLIIGREVDSRYGILVLKIRDDLPSTCNCPLHQMLAGREVVSVGWSRFYSGGGAVSLEEKGKAEGTKYLCHDLAPERFLMVSRQKDDTLEVHLAEQWNPFWTLREVQNRLAGLFRYVYR